MTEFGSNIPEGKHELDMRTDELIEAAEIWAKDRPEIVDAEMAAKCKDFLDQCRTCAKEVDATRKKEKKPHQDAGKAVDARWNPLKLRLDKVKAILEPRMRKWLIKMDWLAQEEKKRQEDEALKAAQAAQQASLDAAQSGGVQDAVEADEKLDEARELLGKAEAATGRGQVSGALGGKAMSLRARWTFAIDDEDKIPRKWMIPDEQAIGLAVRRKDNPVRDIPGVRIFEKKSAV